MGRPVELLASPESEDHHRSSDLRSTAFSSTRRRQRIELGEEGEKKEEKKRKTNQRSRDFSCRFPERREDASFISD